MNKDVVEATSDNFTQIIIDDEEKKIKILFAAALIAALIALGIVGCQFVTEDFIMPLISLTSVIIGFALSSIFRWL